MVTEGPPRPPALAARARSGFSGAAAGWFLLAVAVLTAVYATDPTSIRGVAAYIAICIGAGAATVCGTGRYRPMDRTAWYVLALAPLLGCVGMVLRLLLAGVGGTMVSLIPELVTIGGYLLLIAGLLRFLRARRGSGAGSALDGGLMAVAALVVTWATLIEPVLADAELPAALKVVNGAYPTISVAVLFVGALLAMTEVRSILAFWMLALGWVGLLIGDLVYAFASVGTVTLPLWAAHCAYCAFFGLLGAAGLHPSMASLSRPAATRLRGYGHGRFVAVAVALVVPAAVVAVGLPVRATDRAVSAILLSLLGVLVLVRITRAVNSHARSELLLEHQANHDFLTGLPNRLRLGSHLAEALGRARIAGRGVSVVFMDLDQFKVVNDSWGHETGDELLSVVAARLSAAVRQGELVARMGGDEFVIVCEDVDTASQAVDAGSRLLAVFGDPVALSSAQVPVTSSVGVAFAVPSVREVTVEDLLREADTAMYRSKMRGGAAVVLFDESMRKQVAERIALESSLVGALERGELELFYQPIVDLHSGITTGFEALMRWQHPDLGMVPPNDFIPVAEDTGLIIKLGRWAIEQAAFQLREWHREFGDTLSMSVNLSPRQMLDSQLVPTVRRSLGDNRLPGGALCLEVTESALMENIEITMATIMQLKQLGVRLSADDFGTGYSSLAHLRMFPFDEVKVDRSFVAGLGDGGEDDVIVGAVLSMAQALSLATVAEGVETTTQRDRLIELGADHAQGWLFSAPLCARDATKHLFDVHGRAPIER